MAAATLDQVLDDGPFAAIYTDLATSSQGAQAFAARPT